MTFIFQPDCGTNMAMARARERKERPPLDAKALEDTALAYAARFATTRARLRAYLARKLRERGWNGGNPPDLEALAERLAMLGYVDDRAFASARAEALGRRGYGEHRVSAALLAAGIGEEDGSAARASARDGAWQAALRYAERRKLGPFALREGDRAAREKALAAMLRAGHPAALARRIAWASPGEIPDADSP